MQSGFLFQDVQFGDLDLYSEDAWMSVSVSFNPYQCDLSPLTVSYSKVTVCGPLIRIML